MAGADKTVKVTLVAVAQPYVKGVTEASTATRKLGADINKAGEESKGLERGFGKASAAVKGLAVGAGALAGTALVSFLSDSVKAAGDLEQSVGGVDAVFKGSAKAIHDFGKNSAEAVGLSRNEFNELITVTGAMLKNKGLEDFTQKSLDLVKIGADLSATYGGSAKEAVEALNAAMRGESDPIERYGISLNETAVNAELAKKGLKGLTGQALEQAKAQARIDIITRQSADALGKFASEADTLQGQQQRLTAQWEDAKAELGQALLPALTSVTQALRGGVDIVVAAAHAWEQIPGPIKAAVGALVAFRLAQGPLTKGAGIAVDTLKSLREALSYASLSAQRAGGGFTGLSAGLRTFTGSAGLAKGAMSGMKAAGSALMGLAGGPWGLAITGLTLALGGYMQAQENAQKAAEEFADSLDKQTGAFTKQSRELALNKFFKDFSQEDYAKVKGSLEGARVGVADLIAAYEQGGPAVTDFKNRFDAWQRDLAPAGVNVEALGNSYAALGRDIERGKKIADETADAQNKLAGATSATGGAADDAQQPVQEFADITARIQSASEKAASAQHDLAAAINDMKDAAVDADKAEANWQEAIDEVNASIEENGRTVNKARTALDLNTEAGRKNQDALIALRDAARDKAEAMLRDGEATDLVKRRMGEAREEFVRAAEKMGLSKTAAEKLATQYGLTKDDVTKLKDEMGKIPKEVKSQVEMDTANALLEIAALQRKLALLEKRIDITTYFHTAGDVSWQAAKNRSAIDDIRNNAAGGYIAGPGTGTSDSIPSWLSNGEYVIKAAAVSKYGKNFFDSLNTMRFAEGGYVSRMAPSSSIDYDRLAAVVGSGTGAGLVVQIPGSDPLATARHAIDEWEWRAING